MNKVRRGGQQALQLGNASRVVTTRQMHACAQQLPSRQLGHFTRQYLLRLGGGIDLALGELRFRQIGPKHRAMWHGSGRWKLIARVKQNRLSFRVLPTAEQDAALHDPRFRCLRVSVGNAAEQFQRFIRARAHH